MVRCCVSCSLVEIILFTAFAVDVAAVVGAFAVRLDFGIRSVVEKLFHCVESSVVCGQQFLVESMSWS